MCRTCVYSKIVGEWNEVVGCKLDLPIDNMRCHAYAEYLREVRR